MKPFSIIRLLFFVLTIYSQTLKGQISDRIMGKAEFLLKNKLGNDYFNKAKLNCKETGGFYEYSLWELCPDTTYIEKLTKKEKKYLVTLKRNYKPESYWFAYDLELNLCCNYKIEFKLDTLGHFAYKTKIEVPDTINHYELYNLKIDSVEAKRIAISSGIRKGIKPWNISVKFVAKRFYWEVEATLTENKGELIYIDAITGQINEMLQQELERSIVR